MIVACGEALIDLVPRTCDGEVAFLPRAGGSPFNVAIGLARLDVPVGFLGRVSGDAFGRLLRTRLEREGVATDLLRTGPEPSTVAIVHLAPGEEPAFAFYGHEAADVLLRPADLPPDLPDAMTALHLGSISLLREPAASTFEALMLRERDRRTICLDPNVRPSLIPDRDRYLARLEGWLRCATLVKVSAADLRWLAPGEAELDVAARWLALGPALVVVTRGEDGATGVRTGSRVHRPARPVQVADTVGAGDAFTSGLLAWLHEHDRLTRPALVALTDDELAAALDQANRVAGLACTRSGAEPPTHAELASVTQLVAAAGRVPAPESRA